MSDKPLFSVAVSEGPHDVAAAIRILRLKGFREVRGLNDIPEILRRVIPTHYPWGQNGTELSRFVAHPSFLVREGYWILVSNADGESKLGSHLKSILSPFYRQDVTTMLRGIAVLADADKDDASEKKAKLLQKLTGEFKDSEWFSLDPAAPEPLRLYESVKPFAMYIFPDCQHSGTLEQVLLDGARYRYPALLAEAEKYVAFAQTCPDAQKLAANSNGAKATVGVVANAIRPGRANQVSICEDEWFTPKSLTDLPSHRSLSAFIDAIISWETA